MAIRSRLGWGVVGGEGKESEVPGFLYFFYFTSNPTQTLVKIFWEIGVSGIELDVWNFGL
jgi:hypothetical protein